ncbi:alpha/beta hydrolase [Streptomyces sp. NPDC101166]|uniref:alpha/beta hydrolase n=1 Tax=Streptomyces sp. NPDC101166 TaxID=3366120 RepID=UPI0037F66349
MNRTPVVFIHGAWLHALSWQSWVERFAGRGFLALAPGWPGEAAAAGQTRTPPEALAGVGLEVLTDHYEEIVRSCETAPVIVGHSVGGLIAQRLLGADLGRAAVAIAPAPINGLALPASSAPWWTPGRTGGAEGLVSLSPGQFHHAFANTITAQESGRLFERHVVPAPRALLADLAGGVGSPYATADVGNAGRGPLLLVSGQEDRLVPDSVTRAVYKQYGDSRAVTDLKQFADRAHCLVIDSGWRSVADHVLGWLDEHGLGAHRS